MRSRRHRADETTKRNHEVLEAEILYLAAEVQALNPAVSDMLRLAAHMLKKRTEVKPRRTGSLMDEDNGQLRH